MSVLKIELDYIARGPEVYPYRWVARTFNDATKRHHMLQIRFREDGNPITADILNETKDALLKGLISCDKHPTMKPFSKPLKAFLKNKAIK